MKKDRKMQKTISAMKARQNLGQVMNEVALRGDDYIIERAGKPLVAIIPIEKYQKLQRDRDDFYGLVQQFQESARNVDTKELDEAIDEAIKTAKQETVAKVRVRQTQ